MPTHSLVQFEWFVPAHGFQWTDATTAVDGRRRTRGRFLTFATEAWPGRVNYYHPFREWPSLFDPFARVTVTEEGVQAFANRYGALVLDELITPRRRGTRTGRAYQPVVKVSNALD